VIDAISNTVSVVIGRTSVLHLPTAIRFSIHDPASRPMPHDASRHPLLCQSLRHNLVDPRQVLAIDATIRVPRAAGRRMPP